MIKLLVILCEVMIELFYLCFLVDLIDSCVFNDCMFNGYREGLMVNVVGLYVKKKIFVVVEFCRVFFYLEFKFN